MIWLSGPIEDRDANTLRMTLANLWDLDPPDLFFFRCSTCFSRLRNTGISLTLALGDEVDWKRQALICPSPRLIDTPTRLLHQMVLEGGGGSVAKPGCYHFFDVVELHQ